MQLHLSLARNSLNGSISIARRFQILKRMLRYVVILSGNASEWQC